MRGGRPSASWSPRSAAGCGRPSAPRTSWPAWAAARSPSSPRAPPRRPTGSPPAASRSIERPVVTAGGVVDLTAGVGVVPLRRDRTWRSSSPGPTSPSVPRTTAGPGIGRALPRRSSVRPPSAGTGCAPTSSGPPPATSCSCSSSRSSRSPSSGSPASRRRCAGGTPSWARSRPRSSCRSPSAPAWWGSCCAGRWRRPPRRSRRCPTATSRRCASASRCPPATSATGAWSPTSSRRCAAPAWRPERLVLQIGRATVQSADERVALDVSSLRLMGVHVALEGFGGGALGAGPPHAAAHRHRQAGPVADHPAGPRPAEPGAVRVPRRHRHEPRARRRRRGRGDAGTARRAVRVRLRLRAGLPASPVRCRCPGCGALADDAGRGCGPGWSDPGDTGRPPLAAAATGRPSSAGARRGRRGAGTALRPGGPRTRPRRARRWPRSPSACRCSGTAAGSTPVSTATWRGFAVIAALLALGQGIRAVGGVGHQPRRAGALRPRPGGDRPGRGADLRPAGAVDRRPDPRAGGARRRRRADRARGAAGDARPAAPWAGRGPADLLLTSATRRLWAVLCAVGLVTFAGVSAPRRAAAGWLLACFASLAVAMVSGALAVGRPRRSSTSSPAPRTWPWWPRRRWRWPATPGRGPTRGARRRGAARRRRRQLLPGLRRAAAAARRPGAPAGRWSPLEAVTVAVLLVAHLRPDPGLGARRRPADPPGAAHRGLLPHPGAPLGRPHPRARRPRPGDLGVERRTAARLDGPRPRGPAAAGARARGRPARAARGARPGG